MLTGLVICRACNTPLAPAVDSHTDQPRYVCALGQQPDCAMVCCSADHLDDLIMRLAQQYLEHADLIVYPSPWPTATIEQRRELITPLVTSVTLRPSQAGAAGQLDPAAVSITWGV